MMACLVCSLRRRRPSTYGGSGSESSIRASSADLTLAAGVTRPSAGPLGGNAKGNRSSFAHGPCVYCAPVIIGRRRQIIDRGRHRPFRFEQLCRALGQKRCCEWGFAERAVQPGCTAPPHMRPKQRSHDRPIPHPTLRDHASVGAARKEISSSTQQLFRESKSAHQGHIVLRSTTTPSAPLQRRWGRTVRPPSPVASSSALTVQRPTLSCPLRPPKVSATKRPARDEATWSTPPCRHAGRARGRRRSSAGPAP